nr:hypothetical protein [Blautia obeum]
MIVLIDNYDSFSYNVYQLIGSVEPDIKVVRNDEYTVKEIEAMRPEALIISPGPGKPSDAGICIEAIRYFVGRLPILGICLGHQAICEAFWRRSFLCERADAWKEKKDLYGRKEQDF